MAILPKVCQPDTFVLCNPLKFSFASVWDLCSNYIWCESFLESKSDIFALYGTKLNGSVDSGSFSVIFL